MTHDVRNDYLKISIFNEFTTIGLSGSLISMVLYFSLLIQSYVSTILNKDTHTIQATFIQ